MTLTQKDLDEIEQLIRKTVKEEIKHLPNKEEFYRVMDKVMGELKAMRETYDIISPRVSEHEERITSLEEIHPSGKHPTL